MRGILLRYVFRTYLLHALAVFSAVLAIFLVTDFVDRAKFYTGEHVVRDVAELYGYKALVFTHQLGSAVLLLGAAAAVSTLKRRGELTAFRALSFGPSVLYVPIGLTALLASLSLIAFDETVVSRANLRVEEISAHRFGRWGDWGLFFTPKRWFRRGDSVYFLRAGNVRDGFEDVTVLRLGPDFELAERIDAKRMSHLQEGSWTLTEATRRTFGKEGSSQLSVEPTAQLQVGAGPEGFHIRQGRPEQMRLDALLEQIRTRREVGLPAEQFELAVHNRFAYPLAGLPAALLAVGLALRPGRKGHLATALVEGLAVAVVLWGIMVVGRTLVASGRLSPALGAWSPVLVLGVAAAGLWANHAGAFRWVRR